MSELAFTITGDANPLLRSFSRVKSAARIAGKDIGNALGTAAGIAGGGAPRAGSGGLRGMLASGIGMGMTRLGGWAAGILGASALTQRSLQQGKEAAETVKGAREAGLSPSDYAALQIATERYGQAILNNKEQLTTAMREIKSSGEVLSDVDYEKMAANSTELAKSLNILDKAFAPLLNVIAVILAQAAKWYSMWALVGSSLLKSTKMDEGMLSGLMLPGGQPGAVDEAAVQAHLNKKRGGNQAIVPFRIPRTGDPQGRIGLFTDQSSITTRDLIKNNQEQLKAMRGIEAGVRRLIDTTKAL